MCCASTSPIRWRWDERMAVLKESASRLAERRFDAVELRGPGTELTIGLLPTASWWSADFLTAEGLRHLPNLPTEEVFTTPDPLRTEGHVTSTKPLVLQDGTIVRGLRVRFEGGKAVESTRTRTPRRCARGSDDEGALRLGELALVDRKGRIGRSAPSSTTRCSTRTPPVTSRSGAASPSSSTRLDRDRVNESATHVDFMIGSPELEVTASPPPASACPCCAAAAGSLARPRRPVRGPAQGRPRTTHARPEPERRPKQAVTDLAVTLKEALRMTATELPGQVTSPSTGSSRPHRSIEIPPRRCSTRTRSRAATGSSAEGGPLAVDTGKFTGRSPKDKFLVEEDGLAGPHLVGRGQPASRGGEFVRCATRSRRNSKRPTLSTWSTRGPAPTLRTASVCA